MNLIRDGLLACLFITMMFFIAVQQERLNAEKEELKSEEAKFVYHLVRANREIDFTIKRFEQLKEINQSLKDYCIKYNYRGWVTYDSQFYFPCQMLNPDNKIRAFTSLELTGANVAREGLTSNKLQ